tara:strand:- start:33 stop:356 length:324 start_codon:yes stop_codon:yes gene_type:complete
MSNLNEYTITEGTFKGLKTKAKNEESAKKNLRAQINRHLNKLSKQEEAIILLALSWYVDYGFDSDDEERGLTAESVNEYRLGILRKLKLKTQWNEILDLDFKILTQN